jgi:hypothetical protein
MIQRLTWIEKKMEFMFDCHMYSELKKNWLGLNSLIMQLVYGISLLQVEGVMAKGQ